MLLICYLCKQWYFLTDGDGNEVYYRICLQLTEVLFVSAAMNDHEGPVDVLKWLMKDF